VRGNNALAAKKEAHFPFPSAKERKTIHVPESCFPVSNDRRAFRNSVLPVIVLLLYQGYSRRWDFSRDKEDSFGTKEDRLRGKRGHMKK
jgi:hypothetical protein